MLQSDQKKGFLSNLQKDCSYHVTINAVNTEGFIESWWKKVVLNLLTKNSKIYVVSFPG